MGLRKYHIIGNVRIDWGLRGTHIMFDKRMRYTHCNGNFWAQKYCYIILFDPNEQPPQQAFTKHSKVFNEYTYTFQNKNVRSGSSKTLPSHILHYVCCHLMKLVYGKWWFPLYNVLHFPNNCFCLKRFCE